MAYSQAWKSHEKRVANALQGHRIPRGANFSDSLPDVIADASKTLARSKGIIYAECKHSINSPWVDFISDIYINRLIQIKNTKTSQVYIFFQLEDMHLLSNPINYTQSISVVKTIPKYIENNIAQCRKYIPDTLSSISHIMMASIQQWTGTNEVLISLPVVVMAKKYKEFRLAYTTVDDLLKFYTRQNDKSYWKV